MGGIVIKLNKTYDFYVDNCSFGLIPVERVIEMFKDGRVAAPFLEEHLTHWFPQLTRILGNKDHDHVDENGVKYDAKNFTKNGLKFKPSNQIGEGRKFVAEVAHTKAKKLIYICCDIIDFPKVRVRFEEGKKMIKKFPRCEISPSKREAFFG